ncbi:integrin alpha-9-like isoform X2 [Tachypleus tridentatus]
MWFGVSMDVQHNGQNNVVVCGHLWKNQKFSDYWANGVCYLLTKDLTLLNGNKYLPLVDRSKNTKYVNSTQVNYYQYGQFGISTSFTQDEKRLVFGAPGFFEWTGTGLGYEVEESGKLSKPIIPNPTYVYRKYPYIGYSVTTGKFFKLSETESVVLGAPRDSDASGKVYIISGYAFFTSKSFKEEAKFEGSQMGEYFGATVLALDLNNDKYSDLLVGAPLFSLESGSDEGRVYLYLSDGVGLQLSSVKLIGSKTYNSRFGSTLAKVGDLDQDGYLDVAIGAPYEDDRGAVYIYNGSPETGLKPKFSQRIFAADVDQNYNLRGFGISIAKSIDVDDNLYQDLLIGAHESGHAVLLRTNPVAHIECNLSFNKDVIDRNHLDCSYNDEQYSCVELNYCIQYNGRNLPKSQTLQVKITSDVTQSGKPSRGFFVQDQQRKQDFILALNLLYDSPYCGRENFYIKNNLNDLSPLTFTLSYALLSEPSSVFCKNCPIVNKDQPSAMMKKIKFYISCGKEECVSDLKVSANILNYKEGETLVIGQNTSLTLEIQVTNQINPAHDAKAFIKIPPDVAVMNQDRCYIITGNSDNTLQCDIGNPLNINDIVKFQVKLDTSKLTGKSKEIKIDINVISQSKEQHLLDNSVSVIVSFIAKTHISITGFTERTNIIWARTTRCTSFGTRLYGLKDFTESNQCCHPYYICSIISW